MHYATAGRSDPADAAAVHAANTMISFTEMWQLCVDFELSPRLCSRTPPPAAFVSDSYHITAMLREYPRQTTTRRWHAHKAQQPLLYTSLASHSRQQLARIFRRVNEGASSVDDFQGLNLVGHCMMGALLHHKGEQPPFVGYCGVARRCGRDTVVWRGDTEYHALTLTAVILGA